MKLDCFLFVLCHSQDAPPGLCQEVEKGISGCSTLTKLSVEDLTPQYSSAIVRAAMALQSTVTEVDWSYCRFDGKSKIGLTVLVYCVVCARCVVRESGYGGSDWLYLHVFALVCMCACLCVHVFEMYCMHIICECSYK